MNIDIFSNQILFESIDIVNRIFILIYTDEDDNAKRFKTRQNYW